MDMKAEKRFRDEINQMELVLPAISVNEGMARAAVAAFCAQLSPDTTELADIKCAVSEAVTNCIVHAYKHKKGNFSITVKPIPLRSPALSVVKSGSRARRTSGIPHPLSRIAMRTVLSE